LQDECLDQTLPGIFLNPQRRLLIFLMKALREKKMAITIDNLLLLQVQPDDTLKAFMKKHNVKVLTESELIDMLDIWQHTNCSDDMFEKIKTELLLMSFARFIEDILSEMKYYNGFMTDTAQNVVISKMKAGIKLHDILYGRVQNKRDMLKSAQDYINSDDEYIRTPSQVLNSFIGGFSRGYVNTLIAKSSHCKSSWTDFCIDDMIINGKVHKIVKVTPEEDSDVQIRRHIAALCKIPLTAMLLKTIKITDEHLKIVRDKLSVGNRLIIHDGFQKEDKIKEILNSINDADFIVVDHINGIDFPGHKGWLDNMISGIPGFIMFCKALAKRKNIYGRKPSVLLLSQVNDKEIQRSERLIKAPRYYDAYGSSTLFHASRQMLSLWYPYKDKDESSVSYDHVPDTINDLQMSIEKSSFSSIGKIQMHFEPEYNMFRDASKKVLKKLSYEAADENLF
jgi:hypothetical protein